MLLFFESFQSRNGLNMFLFFMKTSYLLTAKQIMLL